MLSPVKRLNHPSPGDLTMPKIAAISAADFLAKAREYGVSVEIRGSILTLSKTFTPGSNEEYVAAESDVGLIYEAPQSAAGSTWGTDGGSIGGAVGLQGGYMKLNRSGVNKMWLKRLAKALAA